MAKENTVIQLYGAVSGTAVSVDVPDDGFLLTANIEVALGASATGDNHSASLEFGATNSILSHDTRTLLAVVHGRFAGATAAVVQTIFSRHYNYGDPGIAVFGGERLYLHNLAGAGTFSFARAQLIFSFAKFVARRR